MGAMAVRFCVLKPHAEQLASQSARSFRADERRSAEDVGVGVDEDFLEDGELASEGHQRDLRRDDGVDGAELVLERIADAGPREKIVDRDSRHRRGRVVVRFGGAPVCRDLLDVVGETGRHMSGAACEPNDYLPRRWRESRSTRSTQQHRQSVQEPARHHQLRHLAADHPGGEGKLAIVSR